MKRHIAPMDAGAVSHPTHAHRPQSAPLPASNTARPPYLLCGGVRGSNPPALDIGFKRSLNRTLIEVDSL